MCEACDDIPYCMSQDLTHIGSAIRTYLLCMLSPKMYKISLSYLVAVLHGPNVLDSSTLCDHLLFARLRETRVRASGFGIFSCQFESP